MSTAQRSTACRGSGRPLSLAAQHRAEAQGLTVTVCPSCRTAAPFADRRILGHAA